MTLWKADMSSDLPSELNQDQCSFRDVVARFMTDKSHPSEVRRLMATKEGFDTLVWRQLCDEVGLAGTHIPEAYGGFGFGPVELGIVAEQMGRHLYCGPFFASTVMAGYAILLGAEEAGKQALLPGIALGSTIATLVMDDLNRPENVGKGLVWNGETLSGTAPLVLDAQNADLLIVIAGTTDGLCLLALNSQSAGVNIMSLETLDSTRKLANVTFSQANAEKLGDLASTTLDNLWDHVCVALAHEMIGGAQHLFETTVEYTKLRYQFGRPIGSFQGLKHRCADLLMELEFAKAATHHAAQCLASGEREPYVASMAKALASDAYIEAGRAAIQLRGGIGFTWEEDTQLWFKRAKSSEVFMGAPHLHRERMMTMLEVMA
jgi:alkylation response protein AidB-like acyl-CoA dehydrogenase